jgi:hypothetical protein
MDQVCMRRTRLSLGEAEHFVTHCILNGGRGPDRQLRRGAKRRAPFDCRGRHGARMTRFSSVACAMLLAAVAAAALPSRAEGLPRTVPCGGPQMTYGMSIGTMGPSIREQHERGIMAATAVTTHDLHARAWLIWDETAQPWLAIARNTPTDLQRLWIFPKKPDFAGPGVQVRWTPVKLPLPGSYRLTSCPDVLPYGTSR